MKNEFDSVFNTENFKSEMSSAIGKPKEFSEVVEKVAPARAKAANRLAVRKVSAVAACLLVCAVISVTLVYNLGSILTPAAANEGKIATLSDYKGGYKEYYSIDNPTEKQKIVYENVANEYSFTYDDILNNIQKEPCGLGGAFYGNDEIKNNIGNILSSDIQPGDFFEAMLKPTGNYTVRRVTYEDILTGERTSDVGTPFTIDLIFTEMEISQLFSCGDEIDLNKGDKIYLSTNYFISNKIDGKQTIDEFETSQIYFLGHEYLSICLVMNPFANAEDDKILYFTPASGCVFDICTFEEYLKQANGTSEIYNESWKNMADSINFFKPYTIDSEWNYITLREKAFRKYLPELGEEYYTCSGYEKEQAEKQAEREAAEEIQRRDEERAEYYRQKELEAGNSKTLTTDDTSGN